jgi:hypothetical protein
LAESGYLTDRSGRPPNKFLINRSGLFSVSAPTLPLVRANHSHQPRVRFQCRLLCSSRFAFSAVTSCSTSCSSGSTARSTESAPAASPHARNAAPSPPDKPKTGACSRSPNAPCATALAIFDPVPGEAALIVFVVVAGLQPVPFQRAVCRCRLRHAKLTAHSFPSWNSVNNDSVIPHEATSRATHRVGRRTCSSRRNADGI